MNKVLKDLHPFILRSLTINEWPVQLPCIVPQGKHNIRKDDDLVIPSLERGGDKQTERERQREIDRDRHRERERERKRKKEKERNGKEREEGKENRKADM